LHNIILGLLVFVVETVVDDIVVVVCVVPAVVIEFVPFPLLLVVLPFWTPTVGVGGVVTVEFMVAKTVVGAFVGVGG
jgi:hypothetical protein